MKRKWLFKKYKKNLNINTITKRMETLEKFSFNFNFISWRYRKRTEQVKKKEGFTKVRCSYKKCQGKCRCHIPFLAL